MRRLLCFLFMGLSLPALLCACGDAGTAETITNRRIPVADVTEFYYTYENINYHAFYQRYRFYAEDGKYLFQHETRERPNDYGPATEADTTAAGTRELTPQEWLDAMALLQNGTVSKRSDPAESGSFGPWTYIYWKNDKSRYQEFAFSSYAEQIAFEEYCSALALGER